jgi:hypothetical protein
MTCQAGGFFIVPVGEPMIDYKGIADELLINAERYVREWLPGGVKQGNEYLPLNPKRDDKKPGSFSINIKTGAWLEGATGDKGGDLLSLYAYINDMSQGEAAKALSVRNSISGRARNQAKGKAKAEKVDNGFTLCLPVPDDAPNPYSAIKIGNEYRKPSAVYTYADANGAVMRLIYRFEVGNGLTKKEFRPLTCWRDKNGVLGWKFQDIPDKRPLYQLDELERRPNEPVLLVEGEKCVEAVKKLLPGYVVMTWHGGVNGIKKTDFSPLQGRQLVFWPDNDDVGKNTMQHIADKYGGNVLHFDSGKYPQGWDCADAVVKGWGKEELEAFIKSGVSDEAKSKYQPSFTERMPNGMLIADDKGRVEATLENFTVLLDYYRLKIWRNEINKQVECNVGDGNSLNMFYSRVRSVSNLNRFPRQDVMQYVDAIAEMRKVNYVRDWIYSKKWDGVRRVMQLCDTVVCDDSITHQFKSVLIFKWLISAFAAVVRKDGDDFRSEGVLVLQGNQGIGKTTFLRNLCGADWGGDVRWFGEGLTLDPENKDSVLNTQRFWIVELAELENTTKRSMPALKAFITSPSNTIRAPYARSAECIWSRTAYAGTMNQKDVLTDDTGNRRFWILPVVKFEDTSHINMQQVWAEIRYKKEELNAEWWLTSEEKVMLEENSKEYRAVWPVVELLASQLDWDTNQHISMWPKKTCTVILKECGMSNPTQGDARRAAYFMRERLGLEKAPKISTGGARFYPCPPFRQT